MYYIVVASPQPTDSEVSPRHLHLPMYKHTADYVQALTVYRQWERALAPKGFVILAEVEGLPDTQTLDVMARNMTPGDDAIIRSRLGPDLAQAYAAQGMPRVSLTAKEFNCLNAQKYLLLRLLDGERLNDKDLTTLGGLVDTLDAMQDSASAQGIPDGVIWPDTPFGSGNEEESRLVVDHPDLARQLLGHR